LFHGRRQFFAIEQRQSQPDHLGLVCLSNRETPVVSSVRVQRMFVHRWRCSSEAAKYETLRVTPLSILRTVHPHTSKALDACSIGDLEGYIESAEQSRTAEHF